MTKRKAEVEAAAVAEQSESEEVEMESSEEKGSSSEVEEEETAGGFKSKGKKVGWVGGRIACMCVCVLVDALSPWRRVVRRREPVSELPPCADSGRSAWS